MRGYFVIRLFSLLQLLCYSIIKTTKTNFFIFLYFARKVVFLKGCLFRSSRPEVFLGKGVPKICIKFTGENPCRSVISIELQSNFIEITLLHGCSPLNLLHLFGTPFLGTLLDGCFCLFSLVSYFGWLQDCLYYAKDDITNISLILPTHSMAFLTNPEYLSGF